MFILILTYQKALNEVDKHLEAHKQYLEKFYQSGNFIASGRQKPRIGGIILCNANNKEEVENIISHDPFCINQIAIYQIIEFEPTLYNNTNLQSMLISARNK